MIGAIAGDIVGRVYEYHPIKTEEFPLFGESSSFTDDTVLTVATADALLDGTEFAESYKRWGLRYPEHSYGSVFRPWLQADDLAPWRFSTMCQKPTSAAGVARSRVTLARRPPSDSTLGPPRFPQ